MNNDYNLDYPGRRTTALELLTIIIINDVFYLNFYVVWSGVCRKFPRGAKVSSQSRDIKNRPNGECRRHDHFHFWGRRGAHGTVASPPPGTLVVIHSTFDDRLPRLPEQ